MKALVFSSTKKLTYKTVSKPKLKKNELAGAILDVFDPEPIDPNSKLWDTPNLIITPHVSSDDGESYIRLTLELFVKNLELFVANKPLINKIDKKLGY